MLAKCVRDELGKAGDELYPKMTTYGYGQGSTRRQNKLGLNAYEKRRAG
jgi:hypothetical protein